MGMTASQFLTQLRDELNEQLQKCNIEPQISATQALNKLAMCEKQTLLNKREQKLLMEQIVIGEGHFNVLALSTLRSEP